MDRVDKETRSKIMSRIRSRDTKMELAVRPVLEALGFTYHPENGLPIPGAPDFAHLTEHIAVFLDGCFWHGCPEHYKMPQTNRESWAKKITQNIIRDAAITAKYKDMGWTVIRVWEHDLKELVKNERKREKTGENKSMD